MTPKEFVKLFYNNKNDYLRECLNENSGLFVSDKMKELNLNYQQKQIMAEVVNGILTDTYYEILLGLDGSASIGGLQVDYELYDEDGNLLTDCGEIEAEAWKLFQDDSENIQLSKTRINKN